MKLRSNKREKENLVLELEPSFSPSLSFSLSLSPLIELKKLIIINLHKKLCDKSCLSNHC